MTRHAIVLGADPARTVEIASRLRADGIMVVDDIAACVDDIALDILVTDLTTVPQDVPFRAVRDDDLQAVLETQLHAFVAAVQAAVPRMTAGGAIVQIVSTAHLGAWGGVHLAAASAACIAMARSMAIELAPRGIRVNSVATGAARAGVAEAACWLAGPASGAITGETIFADRGASLQMAQAARR